MFVSSWIWHCQHGRQLQSMHIRLKSTCLGITATTRVYVYLSDSDQLTILDLKDELEPVNGSCGCTAHGSRYSSRQEQLCRQGTSPQVQQRHAKQAGKCRRLSRVSQACRAREIFCKPHSPLACYSLVLRFSSDLLWT